MLSRCTLVGAVDWEPFLVDQKVPLLDVKTLDYGGLVTRKLAEYLKSLERESLLKKIDRLFQTCTPPAAFRPVVGYQFDRARLECLDAIRHDIIHSDTAALPRDVDDALNFLLNTGLFSLGLLNHKYDFRLDPAYVPKAPGSRAGPM